MSDICGDNRFEIIEAYKRRLIEATNIESSPEEMAVIDNVLFRFWQMGWLPSAEPTQTNTSNTLDALEARWIPFKTRPLTEEEREDHPEWDCVLDCKLPDNGQRILVSINLRGHEEVQQDEYYSDDGSYLDSGYEIGTEAAAWMPLPQPWKGADK